jgi:hypothetical protein
VKQTWNSITVSHRYVTFLRCINNIEHSLLHNLDVRYFLTSPLVLLLSKIVNQILAAVFST